MRLTAVLTGDDWVVNVSKGPGQEESRNRGSEEETLTVTVPPQSYTNATLSCKLSSKIRQNQGCEMEKEERGKIPRLTGPAPISISIHNSTIVV